jgi:glycosyltransferase involved in cell wall biosynthesis
MSKPAVSVITPFSRGIKEITQLLRDFKNQTFRDFEHIIVSDGTPSKEVFEYIKKNRPVYTRFVSIRKDNGNMKIAPGTAPRNYGISIAQGDYVVFFDDDDRAKDTYLESLITGMRDNLISVIQMSCQESRMFKDGDPTRTRLIPEAGMPYFPIICHVGTPCFIVPRKWALECPWRDEREHDFRFINRIVEKYHPQIRFQGGMQVDVDGIVTHGIRDWVSKPPFYRE